MRVILATRRAGAIALRNPEALVVDYENRCVRRGSDRVSFSYRNAPTKMFQLCAVVCCAVGRDIDRRELIDMLWADDRDGGPLLADGVISVMLSHARPFLRWAGIKVYSPHFFGRIEVRPVAASGPTGESFWLNHAGRRPRRIAA